MQKKNFKGRCLKRRVSKSEKVCRTYSRLADVYLMKLQEDEEIGKIHCNVEMEGLALGDYTTDFLCEKLNGDLLVRECVKRKYLSKPLTVKQLDESRNYWLNRGVTDWGIVTDEE